MDAAPTVTVAEAIAPVLKEAKEIGLDFRPIAGLIAKRAKRLGIDLDEIGRASNSTLSDEDYDDQIKQAAWLLCADEAEISNAIEAGIVPKTVEAWEVRFLQTPAKEKVAYRAMMARWLEYQVELETVFGPVATVEPFTTEPAAK